MLRFRRQLAFLDQGGPRPGEVAQILGSETRSALRNTRFSRVILSSARGFLVCALHQLRVDGGSVRVFSTNCCSSLGMGR
jgi:hypothetical protein